VEPWLILPVVEKRSEEEEGEKEAKEDDVPFEVGGGTPSLVPFSR
jgi:hypothetical protein